MYMALHKEGPPAQPVALGLHRSDYMVDASSSSSSSGKEEEPRLLQVELNTIASSFGCLAAGTAGLHYYLISRYCRHGLSGPGQGRNLALDFLESYLAAHPGVVPPGAAPDEAMALEALRALPVNPTLEALPEAIAAAHEYYGQGRAAVVFVVQPGERNLFDQRFLELALWKSHGVPVVRLTLEQVRCDAMRCDANRWSGWLSDLG
jgi:glutathione synthase